MLYNTEAIVIRSIPYGDTHAIVSLVTPCGTVAAMARGAKRPQSRLAAGVQMCVQGTYAIYQGKGMGNIQQFELLDARRPLRERLELAAYAAYFCELVAAAAEDRPYGSEGFYRQFVYTLDRLIQPGEDVEIVCRLWETKVLRMLGASPDWELCGRCGAQCSDSSTYSVVDGGFLCQRCFTSTPGDEFRRVTHVPTGLPILLNRMAAVPMQRIGNVRLSGETKKALHAVLRLQLSEFAGVSLKTRSVLDSLNLS